MNTHLQAVPIGVSLHKCGLQLEQAIHSHSCRQQMFGVYNFKAVGDKVWCVCIASVLAHEQVSVYKQLALKNWL